MIEILVTKFRYAEYYGILFHGDANTIKTQFGDNLPGLLFAVSTENVEALIDHKPNIEAAVKSVCTHEHLYTIGKGGPSGNFNDDLKKFIGIDDPKLDLIELFVWLGEDSLEMSEMLEQDGFGMHCHRPSMSDQSSK